MMPYFLVMKIQYKFTEKIATKGFDGKKDLSDPASHMTLTCAADYLIRSDGVFSTGNIACGMSQ